MTNRNTFSLTEENMEQLKELRKEHGILPSHSVQFGITLFHTAKFANKTLSQAKDDFKLDLTMKSKINFMIAKLERGEATEEESISLYKLILNYGN